MLNRNEGIEQARVGLSDRLGGKKAKNGGMQTRVREEDGNGGPIQKKEKEGGFRVGGRTQGVA